MQISLVMKRRAVTQKRKGKPLAARQNVDCPYQGSRVRVGGKGRKKTKKKVFTFRISQPNMKMFSVWLSLGPFSISYHVGPEQAEKSRNAGKAPGWNILWNLMFGILYWVLDSTLSNGQTQFGPHPEGPTRMEGALRGMSREKWLKEWRMFTLEKARLRMEEEDNCLENSERLSCEKGIICVFYGPQRDLRHKKIQNVQNEEEFFYS